MLLLLLLLLLSREPMLCSSRTGAVRIYLLKTMGIAQGICKEGETEHGGKITACVFRLLCGRGGGVEKIPVGGCRG